MSRATPQIRAVAARLIAAETQENHAAGPPAPAVIQVGEKLRPQLATLMGKGGFRAVLARALAVAAAEEPGLGAVQVTAEGAIEGWERVPGTPEERAECGVLLVAQLLGLLVAFIGENLTLRLVREVWPQLSLDIPQPPPGDHS